LKPAAETRGTEPGDWVATILASIESGRPFAVATVLQADHSTPVKAGAKAVIEADGTIHGTVGGGAVEAEAQQRARLAVQSGSPLLFEVGLRGPGGDDARPICGGSMRLLVDPTAAPSQVEYRRAADALATRERGLWLTALRQQGSLVVEAHYVAERDFASVGGFPGADALRSCLAEETPELFAAPASPGSERVEVLAEPLVPRPVLLVVGAGHIGQAVAAHAGLLGFEIVVIDDRPEFADPTLFPPGVTIRCGEVAREVAAFPVHEDTFIVLVTRGHQHDAAALRACIRRPAAYIGMIGSRRKVPLVRRQFLEAGWATAAEFDGVYAPIGLDLGAVTVPEIAASIVAQIVAVRRKGTAPRMPLT
jgi:xanthine dehydrogenase accessory factor